MQSPRDVPVTLTSQLCRQWAGRDGVPAAEAVAHGHRLAVRPVWRCSSFPGQTSHVIGALDDSTAVSTTRRRRVWSVLGALVLVATACSSGPPAAPSGSAGATETRAIPADISHAALVDQHGRTVTLASFHGKTVLLVPFLTLCSDICPLTTGNLLQVDRALAASHLTNEVQVIELSVDPGRDSPARLAAYAHLTGSSWELVTESPGDLDAIARFFGFSYQVVPQDDPPAVDWLTGAPLTYDVNHSDGYVLIDSRGILRFSTGAAPDFSGTLNPKLHAFLNHQGLEHLTNPQQPGWTPTDALASLSWLLGKSIPSNAG